MTRPSPGPRERRLTAGQHLSYARGVAVGVDALLKEAKVARRALHAHFAGKDGLVAAVLRRAADQPHLLIDRTLVRGRPRTTGVPRAPRATGQSSALGEEASWR
jgi:AcrR family transcriptional regulator